VEVAQEERWQFLLASPPIRLVEPSALLQAAVVQLQAVVWPLLVVRAGVKAVARCSLVPVLLLVPTLLVVPLPSRLGNRALASVDRSNLQRALAALAMAAPLPSALVL